MKKSTIDLCLVYAAVVASRVPGFFQELSEFQFCDETMFSREAFRMWHQGAWRVNLFHSGGFNLYPPILIQKFLELISGDSVVLSEEGFVLTSRLLFAGLLGSTTVFWLYHSTTLIVGSKVAAWCSVFLYAVSPVVLGVSRYHYPDHYIEFASAACLYFTLLVWKNVCASEPYLRSVLWLAFFWSVLVSIKYSGLLLVCPVLALIVAIVWQQRKIDKVLLQAVLLAIVVGVITFIAFNHTILHRPLSYLTALKVSHYKPHEDWLRGRLFYSQVLMFSSFGVVGSLLYLVGIWRLWSSRIFVPLVLLCTLPVVAIFIMGKYDLLFSRNIKFLLPNIFVLGGIGAAAIFQAMENKNKFVRWIVVTIFLVEPIGRSGFAFVMDFSRDSRALAKEWIDNEREIGTIFNDRLIYSNNGCTYPRLVRLHKVNENASCFDIVVLDSWFGGVDEFAEIKSKDMSFSRVWRSLDFKSIHYLDHNDLMDKKYAKDLISPEHSIIKKFSSYGPRVFVYERSQRCQIQGDH